MPDVTTNSPAETEDLGREWGEKLQTGDVVLLKGELGAGKTTFVRGMAQGAGSRAPVASPTFQLVRIYQGRVQLAHVDLYRVENSAELSDLGLEELAGAGAVVVEWGERLEVDGAALVDFEHLGGDRRRIRTIRDLRH
ncbi:MAG TPA: tRNA (adenosine(37)-N6)-threonylcarbamoyltransferase complex ATPase subunit type 1 TsaE [Candidatus Dormibacteraeota bacterium]|nr:tRNA (adenosine(37)-N6)-threonylcarbamoyltransferase complex ATPase subunit type 1 TsaE [Candidatus Dormibacteraeota bacterium]